MNKESTVIHSLKEIEELLGSRSDKPVVGLVCAHDAHSLEAIKEAMEKGLIRAVLIGRKAGIAELVDKLAVDKECIRILNAETDYESAALGVELARKGEISVLMKGQIQTKDFLKAVVNTETGIKEEGALLSHMAITEVRGYKKLIATTDGGMVIYPNLDEKRLLIKNVVKVFNKLGYAKPKVAVLAAVEVVNPKMPETVDAAALKKDEWPDCVVEGPISYDLTFSEELAALKDYKSDITGDADILLLPNIATANILGKALIYSAGAKMAGIVVGAKVPIVLTSRGASAEEKFYSIVLATLAN